MIQPGATVGDEGTRLGRVMACPCWDCAAYRAFLLRRVALVAVLLGLAAGLALQGGAWNGTLAGPDPMGTAAMMNWF